MSPFLGFWVFRQGIGQFHFPQMKPFKLADYFIKVNLFSIIDMKNSIDFRKTVETGLDPRLIVHADDDTLIIRSQSSQSKKLNLLTWSDLAFGFVNKSSAWVRDGIGYLLSYELELSKSWVWVEVELCLSYQKMLFSPLLFLFLVFSAFLWLVLETTPLQGKRNIVHGRMLFRALFTCSVRVKFFDLLVIQT